MFSKVVKDNSLSDNEGNSFCVALYLIGWLLNEKVSVKSLIQHFEREENEKKNYIFNVSCGFG